MAVNPYFNQNLRGTQNLYEDLVLESIKIYGQDVYYLPRETVNEDTILGDLEASRFGNAYKVEMYIENIEGFDGEGDLFTKFGVEIRDEATFIVARRRWTSAVGRAQNDANIIRPREGDLIYLPLSKSMFQIQHVEHEQPFYQLNNLPIYKMRSQLFEFSGEDFDTGVDDIQAIEENYAYEFLLQLDSGGDFVKGDTMIQTLSDGTVLTGEVSRYSDSDKILGLINFGGNDGLFHLPTTDVFVQRIAADGGGTSLVLSVTENNQLSQNEQNDAFETTTTDLGFLDFSESNPFGDPQ
jgi:hypothetical protein